MAKSKISQWLHRTSRLKMTQVKSRTINGLRPSPGRRATEGPRCLIRFNTFRRLPLFALVNQVKNNTPGNLGHFSLFAALIRFNTQLARADALDSRFCQSEFCLVLGCSGLKITCCLDGTDFLGLGKGNLDWTHAALFKSVAVELTNQ